MVAIPTSDPTRQPDDAPPLGDAPPFDDEPPLDDAPPPDDEPPYPDPQVDPGYREPVAIGDVPSVIPPGRFAPSPADASGWSATAPTDAASPTTDAAARMTPREAPQRPDAITVARQAASERVAETADRPSSAAPAAGGRPTNRATVHPAASGRYGESVVRELLGASFIEEQPHTPPTRFNRD